MIGRTQAIALATFFAAIALAPLVVQPFHLTVLTSMGIYALLALSVCAIVSYAGQFALMQAVSASVAGYAVGFAIVKLAWPFWAGAAIGLVLALVLALAVSTFVFRLRGFYLGIGTLLITLLVPVIEASQFEPWTGGFFGLKVPQGRFELLGLSLEDRNTIYYAMWLAVAATCLFYANLERTRVVRAARAVKANQAAAQLSAIDPLRVKVGMFFMSAVVAAVAGILGMASIRYIDPYTYDISLVIVIFASTIIGGRGSFWGAIVGALFMTGTNQLFQLVQEKGTLAFGLLLVLILLKKPEGLIGYLPSIRRLLPGGAVSPSLARVAVAPAAAREPRERRAAGAAILELDHVSVRFAGFTAVDDVSLRVNEGSIVALLGPNGAGKTTIFNVITGYNRPAAGTVRFGGTDITTWDSYRIRRVGISRTLQIPHAFGELLTWENIALGCDFLYGHGILASGLSLPQARRNERAIEETAVGLALRVGLGEMAYRKASQLSFGQSRLVDVARAMVGNSRLLLLDEPFAGLSPTMIETVKELLLDLRDRGYTILLIDHNFEHVSSICSDGFLLVGGRVSRAGTIDELLHDELVIQQYVGV